MAGPVSKIAHYVSLANGITDGEAEVLSPAFGQLEMIERLEQDDFSWNHNLVPNLCFVACPDAKPPPTFAGHALSQRALFQACQIEAIDVLQQFDKGRDAIVRAGLALPHGCGRGIAHRAGSREILRHPAKAGRPA